MPLKRLWPAITKQTPNVAEEDPCCSLMLLACGTTIQTVLCRAVLGWARPCCVHQGETSHSRNIFVTGDHYGEIGLHCSSSNLLCTTARPPARIAQLMHINGRIHLVFYFDQSIPLFLDPSYAAYQHIL